ncbi:MAG: hypothetical protein ACRCWJ_11650 [Casimicrobium sp.]
MPFLPIFQRYAQKPGGLGPIQRINEEQPRPSAEIDVESKDAGEMLSQAMADLYASRRMLDKTLLELEKMKLQLMKMRGLVV